MIDLAHGLGAMLATVGTVPQRLGALFGSDALLDLAVRALLRLAALAPAHAGPVAGRQRPAS